MTGRLLAVAVAGALMAGCGGDDDAATVVISGLQTEQGTLIGSICGFPGERVHRAGASRARRQLNVLVRELRARPDARVRTFYYADDSLLEKGGRKREILSLLIVFALGIAAVDGRRTRRHARTDPLRLLGHSASA